MKKKWIAGLLALIMIVSLSACGEEEGSSRDRESRRNRDSVESTDDDLESQEEESKEEKPEKEKPEETGRPASGGMLSLDVDADYDGFEYLYCETMMTESKENPETGKMESKSLNVFIPKADYVGVNRDYIYSSKLGVNFRVYLNPYIQYNQEDYTLEENMDYFLQSEHNLFSSVDRQFGLEVSETEKLPTGGMRAYASYCKYDSWDDEYYSVLTTYYMVELDKDILVQVEVEVDSRETTGKTELLLEELETFYGFDIEWSAEQAEQKLQAFLASPEFDKNYVTTGYMVFELPKGWKQDWNWSDDYSEYCYAPDGDAKFAECVITVEREYMGYGASKVEDILKSQSDMDDIRDSYVKDLGSDGASVVVENYGDTVLGACLKISFQVEQDGYTVYHELYYMSQGDYMYTLYVSYTSDTAVEDATGIAENILATAQIK